MESFVKHYLLAFIPPWHMINGVSRIRSRVRKIVAVPIGSVGVIATVTTTFFSAAYTLSLSEKVVGSLEKLGQQVPQVWRPQTALSTQLDNRRSHKLPPFNGAPPWSSR
jgi:hypothetical protein